MVWGWILANSKPPKEEREERQREGVRRKKRRKEGRMEERREITGKESIKYNLSSALACQGEGSHPVLSQFLASAMAKMRSGEEGF